MNSEKKIYKIYSIGIGGQGTVKTATIIGEAAMAQGLNAVMSEVHGMAQRGGTVVTELKIGPAKSPLIEANSADLVFAFEPSELLRILDRMNPDTSIIINHSAIVPFTVSLGLSGYPDIDQMIKELKKSQTKLYLIDAKKIAQEVGHIITTNIVLLGSALAVPGFPVKKENILKSIQKNLPDQFLEMNINALEKGYLYFCSDCRNQK